MGLLYVLISHKTPKALMFLSERPYANILNGNNKFNYLYILCVIKPVWQSVWKKLIN